MKILQVSPLFEQVPPVGYGGTERVVSYLTEELVRRGHEVTLLASGDSRTAARLVPMCERALRTDPRVSDSLPYHMVELGWAFEHAGEFDILHCHVDYLAFPFTRLVSTPTVHTLHGRLDLPDTMAIYRRYRDVPLVSVSDAQRRPVAECNHVATIHHGIPVEEFPFRSDHDGYLLHLGRVSAEKHPEEAIRIAIEAGLPIKVVSKVGKQDEEFFEREVRPLLDHPLVEFLGEVPEERRKALFAGAMAFVLPIDWPEPFGLVMVEAMACGTPVLVRPRGAAPEVVKHGETGFLCETHQDFLDAVRNVGRISREACRRWVEERFTVPVMTGRYLAVYERLIAGAGRGGR